MLRAALVAISVLASCTPSGVITPPDRAAPVAVPLAPMQRFDGTQPRPVPLPDNAQLARDFLELSFGLESGRVLSRFTRFEGPITIGVVDPAPATLTQDLDDLMVRLRREGGLDVSRAAPGEAASISIQAIPRATLQRAVPQAACFVVPNVSDWDGYLANRRSRALDWQQLTTRTRAAVFLPADVSPQEIRDCLHEEIAQALGPLNDLYRLPFSVYNDDNLQTVLTGFDTLMLRVTYDDALKSGMTPQQVADALPGILARINPEGRRVTTPRAASSTPEWKAAITRAVRPTGAARPRIEAARRAVTLARAEGWNDTRLGYSLLAFGRAALPVDAETALSALIEAAGVFRDAYGTEVHVAHAAVQPAAFALSAGQPDVTLRLTDAAIAAARTGQNAALLSTLMLLKAEALTALSQRADAAVVRSEAEAWARYGYGSDRDVRRHVAEVAALRPGV